MSNLARGLATGVRNAWVSLALAAFFFVVAVPANRDLERLMVGFGVVALLVAIAITGFTAAQAHRGDGLAGEPVKAQRD